MEIVCFWFRSEVNSFTQKVNWFRSEVNSFTRKVNWFRSEVNSFTRKVNWFRSEVNSFTRKVNWFRSEVNFCLLIPKGDRFWTFGGGHRRPACVRRWIPWFGWVGFVPLSQSQHGRDGHAPFFCREKSKSYRLLVSDCFSAAGPHSCLFFQERCIDFHDCLSLSGPEQNQTETEQNQTRRRSKTRLYEIRGDLLCSRR